MSLFEFFRQKQIKITPETHVSVRYLTAAKVTDLYDMATGDLLLVKRRITAEDAQRIQLYSGKCTVFTSQPETLEELDAQEKLENSAELHRIQSIGLDYLHFGETLLAFGGFPAEGKAAAVPNTVCISPVHRQDVEMQLSINMGAIAQALGLNDTTVQPESEQSQPEVAGDGTTEQKAPSKADLVRAALKEAFEKQFAVVKAELEGVSFENNTISLSEFYQKHGIAKGRLKGSWRLFEKETLSKIMDEGIVGKARDVVFRKYSASIPGYGRIVRVKDIEAFRSELDKIASDYRRYLDGDKDCTSIGGIPISKLFSPQEAISDSMYALLEYLIEICPVKGLETEEYIQDAKHFVDKTYRKLGRFSDKIHMRMTESSYRDNQWKDREFIDSIWKAVTTNHRFFGDDFVSLLERYSELLYAEPTK